MVAYLQLQLIGDSIRKHEHWIMPLSYWLSLIHLCLGFHTPITGELFQFLSLNSEWPNRGRLNVPISRNIDQRLWSIRYPVELVAAFLSPLSDACLVLSYELCDFWKTKIQTETAQLFWGTNSCSVCYLRRKQYVRIRQQHSMEPILCIHECLDQCTISKPATERKLIRRTKLPKKKRKIRSSLRGSLFVFVSVVRLPIIVMLNSELAYLPTVFHFIVLDAQRRWWWPNLMSDNNNRIVDCIDGVRRINVNGK